VLHLRGPCARVVACGRIAGEVLGSDAQGYEAEGLAGRLCDECLIGWQDELGLGDVATTVVLRRAGAAAGDARERERGEGKEEQREGEHDIQQSLNEERRSAFLSLLSRHGMKGCPDLEWTAGAALRS
jgi:hypothetical protein